MAVGVRARPSGSRLSRRSAGVVVRPERGGPRRGAGAGARSLHRERAPLVDVVVGERRGVRGARVERHERAAAMRPRRPVPGGGRHGLHGVAVADVAVVGVLRVVVVVVAPEPAAPGAEPSPGPSRALHVVVAEAAPHEAAVQQEERRYGEEYPEQHARAQVLLPSLHDAAAVPPPRLGRRRRGRRRRRVHPRGSQAIREGHDGAAASPPRRRVTLPKQRPRISR